MATTVQCDIVSAEESLYSGRVERLVAAGVMGDLGIEPGHAALITPLEPGPVRIVAEGGEEQTIYVSGGFLEVQPNSVTLLADTAIRADDLNEAAALEAKEHALQVIENNEDDFDYAKAMTQLAEATAQLRTLQQLRQKLGRG